jgi:hypothetical protein
MRRDDRRLTRPGVTLFPTAAQKTRILLRDIRRNGLIGAGTGHAIQPRMERIRIEQHSWTGTLWAFGWLFTIGYLHLTFWKGVLALLLWPYDLGLAFSALH